VDDVQFDTERFVARVTFTVDERYQFPKDTFASILTSGLLGEQYIGLSAGGDDVMLKNGEKVTQTQSAVVLEELISKFLFEKASEGAPK
jgi:phospholipid/cholesterol/gamma-HCH transport system substrate-binding protein